MPSTDKNFKARCLFMMAKCAQKQVHQPQYSEYETNWDQYDVAIKITGQSLRQQIFSAVCKRVQQHCFL